MGASQIGTLRGGLVFNQSGSDSRRRSHFTPDYEREPNGEHLGRFKRASRWTGPLISVLFGASRVTGSISNGPSLDQSGEQSHADTEVEASCGHEY